MLRNILSQGPHPLCFLWVPLLDGRDTNEVVIWRQEQSGRVEGRAMLCMSRTGQLSVSPVPSCTSEWGRACETQSHLGAQTLEGGQSFPLGFTQNANKSELPGSQDTSAFPGRPHVSWRYNFIGKGQQNAVCAPEKPPVSPRKNATTTKVHLFLAYCLPKSFPISKPLD